MQNVFQSQGGRIYAVPLVHIFLIIQTAQWRDNHVRACQYDYLLSSTPPKATSSNEYVAHTFSHSTQTHPYMNIYICAPPISLFYRYFEPKHIVFDLTI